MPSLLCSSALAAGGSATEEVCSDQESHCAGWQPSRNKSECTQGQQQVQSRGDLQDIWATSYCSSWKQALLPQDRTHREFDVSSSCSRQTNDSSIDFISGWKSYTAMQTWACLAVAVSCESAGGGMQLNRVVTAFDHHVSSMS